MSSGNNSWEEDFNAVSAIPKRYFLTDENQIKEILQRYLDCCNIQFKGNSLMFLDLKIAYLST